MAETLDHAVNSFGIWPEIDRAFVKFRRQTQDRCEQNTKVTRLQGVAQDFLYQVTKIATLRPTCDQRQNGMEILGELIAAKIEFSFVPVFYQRAHVPAVGQHRGARRVLGRVHPKAVRGC